MPEFLLQRRRPLLVAAVALVLILLAGRFVLGAGTTTPAAPLPPPPADGAGVTGLPSGRGVVDVVDAGGSHRASAPEHGDAGAARLPAWGRARHRAEDPRLPAGARRLQLGRRARRRSRDRACPDGHTSRPGGAVT